MCLNTEALGISGGHKQIVGIPVQDSMGSYGRPYTLNPISTVDKTAVHRPTVPSCPKSGATCAQKARKVGENRLQSPVSR